MVFLQIPPYYFLKDFLPILQVQMYDVYPLLWYHGVFLLP